MRIRAARLPPVLDLPSPASWSSLSAACLRVGAGGAALLPPLSANWPSLCSALWTTSTAAVPRRGQNILIRCDIRWVDAHFVDGVPAGSRRRVVFHGTFCLWASGEVGFFRCFARMGWHLPAMPRLGHYRYYLRGDPLKRAPGDQHRTAPNAHPAVPWPMELG